MTQVFGTNGVDSLVGTKGNDYLNGGGGNDTLSGRGGNDHFGMSLGGGQDVVFDFDLARARSPFDHDFVVFDGWGNFVIPDGQPYLAYTLYDGFQFVTDTGHVLTVVDDGADTVLLWDTGDSLRLAGVDPAQLKSNWISSLDSYGYVF